MIEQLESRTLLSSWATFPSDPGGSTGAAADLGGLNGLRRYTDSLSKGDRVDFYKFSVADKGNFNLAISGIKSNVDVQLLNGDGFVLATSAKMGKTSDKLSRFITGGNYFIRVYTGKGFKSSAYRMQVQADANWGTIGSGSDTQHVGLVFSNDSSQPINRKKETWVLIHGWFAPGRAIALSRLAGAVDKNSKTDQVLLLDWSDAAETINVFDAASRAPAVAQWAADKLRSWGIASSKINIIGHSLGGLVGDILAAKISGGVNRMVALDPATDYPGTFFSGVNFAAHSQYSLGFIGSTWSTPESAATADETFEMNVGPKDSIVTHSNVVDLFASIITRSVAKKPDPIGKFFKLDLLKPAGRPFKHDAFDGTYEGVIDGQSRNGAWWPATFTYKNSSGKTVVVRD